MVEQVLTSKPAGLTVIKEYGDTGSLKDSTRRLMVNIIVAHMCEKEGRGVSKATKEFHTLGIVSLFPSLKDPYSTKGYEHFYDIQSNKGFLEWRLKTVQRQSKPTSTFHDRVELQGGPTSSRSFGSINDLQTGDDCMEAMSLLHHTTDHDLVFQKMRETFHDRQQMIHDQQQSANILQMFPRFLDTKGLILQDFSLMFGAETASRFLERWNSGFKDKVLREARDLRETPLLKNQLNEASDTDEPEWDSDMASLLVLLHLLTPQPAGRKRAKKISVREAIDQLVIFHKSCKSLEDHLMTIEGTHQPYLLATGTSKAQSPGSELQLPEHQWSRRRSCYSARRLMLSVDRNIVHDNILSLVSALCMMFGSYYCFNIAYPSELASTLEFVQRCFSSINPEKGTKVEKTRTSRLHVNPRVLTLIQELLDHEWCDV
ncbi:hypothetical protein KUCAC02_016455 [Chaenocephalus aceratus]|nr:hypothetical protein KUCAC02_016455 [Chaenocephalus aceratus]